jgi:hypothetical protein
VSQQLEAAQAEVRQLGSLLGAKEQTAGTLRAQVAHQVGQERGGTGGAP